MQYLNHCVACTPCYLENNGQYIQHIWNAWFEFPATYNWFSLSVCAGILLHICIDVQDINSIQIPKNKCPALFQWLLSNSLPLLTGDSWIHVETQNWTIPFPFLRPPKPEIWRLCQIVGRRYSLLLQKKNG